MIIDNFNATIDIWMDALKQYTFVQLCSKPSPESWSLGQLCNHLINDTHYYMEQIRICLASNDHSMEDSSVDGRQMLLNNEFPNTVLEGSPDNAYIKQPESRAQMINDLVKLKLEMNNLSMLISKSQFNGKTKHPGLDYFSAIEWLQFADMHFRHHLRQKERIDRF